MNDRYFNEKMETRYSVELDKVQKEAFRETIAFAFESSPFYSRAFKNVGLKQNNVNSIEDLQKSKFFTTKEDLRRTFPYEILAVPRDRVVEIHATSGTTGTPTLGMHTSKDIDDWGEMSARALVMSGLDRKDVFQITPSLGMFSGGFGFYHGARKVGCTIVPSSAGFSKRQIQHMVDFDTTMFAAIVSYTFRLAEIAKEMGTDLKKDTKVRKGIFGSEIWTRETKRRIADIWDLDPYDVYGFTELYGPGVGNDCRQHDGLHIWEDFFLTEVIDPRTGDPLGPEEEGELVFTTLQKQAMPLIRYRSRDISFLLDSTSCDCGRTHPRYSEIKARSDDMLKISGVNFWPSQVEQILLKNEETSSEYNIRIYSSNSMDAMEILVESRDNISEEKKKSLASDLQYELRESLLFSPIIKVVEPNSLPRVEAGKAKRVFDERVSRA